MICQRTFRMAAFAPLPLRRDVNGYWTVAQASSATSRPIRLRFSGPSSKLRTEQVAPASDVFAVIRSNT